MYYVPPRGGYEFTVNNQATPSLTPGTSITPGNNTFPAYAEILPNIAEDCYGIFIRTTGIGATGLSKNALLNIGCDVTGGTTFTTIISSLMVSNAATGAATLGATGVDYYFPLYIPAPSALAAQISVNNATVGTARVYVQLHGKPQYAERCKFGMKVDSFGAVAASSKGTDVTPGNTGAEGTWVALSGTLDNNYFWWQLGAGINNATITNLAYHWDIARGDGTTKNIIVENEMCITGTNENMSMPLSNVNDYQHEAGVGEIIYGRGTCSSTAGTSWSMMAYGVAI